MAADVERLLAADDVAPESVCVLVRSVRDDGQAVAVALEERAVSFRVVGAAAFFERAEIRDVLAWLRLLADPGDAPAVVRALARPPVELRSIDIARCTQIARRRKLDMVSALAAATEAPQVPPEARERILGFLRLYRAIAASLDTTRPDLFVHRLIERLGLRRQQLFAAQADVVERLVNLARFGDLAVAYGRRSPQATPREFARYIAAVADAGLREEEAVAETEPRAVQVMAMRSAKGLEFDHVYLLGMHSGAHARARPPAPEPVPAELARPRRGRLTPRQAHVAAMRRLARRGHDARAPAAGAVPPRARRARRRARTLAVRRARPGSRWVRAGQEREEELFGPAETLQSTFRILRDELLDTVARTAGRLSELRFDTDLDVSHAVVRHLELIKLAALLERPDGQTVVDALPEINARLARAVTSEQREIFPTSALDDYLLRCRARGAPPCSGHRRARRALAGGLPAASGRGAGAVGLRRGDLPDLPAALQVRARLPHPPGADHPPALRDPGPPGAGALPRGRGRTARCAEMLGLLDAGWRRGGFGDTDPERQLRDKATAALTRYHERFEAEESEPVWFERSFSFKLGPHLLRGRVDRVDRLPDGGYELIDYKTGRPKTAAQLREDVQLSLYAVGAREAWDLETSGQAYYYVLDDAKVPVRARRRRPRVDHRHGDGGRRGNPGTGLRAHPVLRGLLDLRLPPHLPGRREVGRRSQPPVTEGRRPRSRQTRAQDARGGTFGAPTGGVALRPALAQEALELAAILSPEDVSARRERRLVVGRRLQALDERLDVGIALHGEVDLALVVAGSLLELGGVHRDADQALQLADQRQRRLRVRGGGDVMRAPRPTGWPTACPPRRTPRAARR